MNASTERYTPEELLDYAVDMEQDGLSTGAAMLRQAATDATRIATLEAEVGRLMKALADVAKASWSEDSEVGDKVREAIRNALKED